MELVEQVIKSILKELESYELNVHKDDHVNGWENTTYRLVRVKSEKVKED